MNIKKYAAILIFLLSILILSNGIYAAENYTEEPTQQEIQNNEENIEQTYVKTSKELSDALEQINESTIKKHEINLKQNNYNLISTFKGDISSETEKEIVINGNNSIINGKNQRPFLTTSKKIKLIINNLSIVNMQDNYGPAIKNYGTIILNNVSFENNNANQYPIGGGVIFTDGSTYINNCTFKNNSGNLDGSVIYINEKVTTSTEINITNCDFTNNYAIKSSIIHILGDTTTNIKNSTFTNNYCNISSIINYKTTLTLEDCEFNQENSSSILSNNEKSILKNCSFNNNILDNIITNNNYLDINDSIFSENEAKTIISNNKSTTINNTKIRNNFIDDSIISNGYESVNDEFILSINNCTISNNVANKTSGIRNYNSNSITSIENSTFSNNTSIMDFGVLYDLTGTMNVINSKFYNNTALNLFKGEIKNFKIVNNNEYKGNYLNSYLNIKSNVNENLLNIVGTVESDPIYNTSITSKIFLKDTDLIIGEYDVLNNNFNLLHNINNNSLDKLTLFFDGNTDFKNLSENVEMSLYNEEFDLEINNISKTYVYGDYITFDLIIKNSGNIIAKNITFNNILPNELIYVNSNETYDTVNNKFLLTYLDINETKIIKFNTKPIIYDDLNLSFQIDDINNNNYSFVKEISFIKPTISIEEIYAHPGEVINISAVINNYNKDKIDNIKFLFKYKEVNNLNMKFENNTLIIENFKLDKTLVKKDYTIEIICESDDLSQPFTNMSKVSVVKYDTHSIIHHSLSGNLLNISGNILDENNNYVNSGSVIIKVNGRTIKTLKVNNGFINLTNHKINCNFKNEYNISLIYTGNNMYNKHSNFSHIKENKKTINLSIDYVIKEDMLNISLRIISNEGIPESGFIAFKINGKSIYCNIFIEEYLTVNYKIDENEDIHNITASYYGNENYADQTSVLPVKL